MMVKLEIKSLKPMRVRERERVCVCSINFALKAHNLMDICCIRCLVASDVERPLHKVHLLARFFCPESLLQEG